MVFGLINHFTEFFFAKESSVFAKHPALLKDAFLSTFNNRYYIIYIPDSFIIAFIKVIEACICNDHNLLLKIIEGYNLIKEHQVHILKVLFICRIQY